MTEAAFELPLDELGEHVAELRYAATHGSVVYLTDGGRRLATVVPFEAEPTGKRSRLFAVSGTLPGFEHDVDVEASRDSWGHP